ncbi:AI-2E family transporter [Haloarchaeobius amylolyticus]|uniref:AI-2E family transporter n=1 Tax=Haloarchaeobius amylolyticus TaxID=1198296 RepID=UPI00226DB2F6|nr:AI-2E family transporter [Haloarchaeobius amylolyticus]
MPLLADRADDRLVWVGLGVALAAVVALTLFQYLGSLVFAVFLYYAMRPIRRRLDDRISHANVRVTVTVLAVAVPILLVCGYAAVLGLQELRTVLAAPELRQYRPAFQPYLDLAREGKLERLWGRLQGGSTAVSGHRALLETALRRVAAVTTVLFGVLSRVFLLTVFLFYLLRDDYRLRAWFCESVDLGEDTQEFLDTVDGDLETVFFGNLATVAVSAVIATVTYLLLNLLVPGPAVVTTPILLGLLTGIGMLVPVVGMKIVYLPYGAYLAVAALLGTVPGFYPVLFLGVAVVLVDTIPDFFVRSFLASRSGLHMGLILLGYVLGSLVFGWYGLFLGPLVVVVLVNYGTVVFPEVAGELTLGS